MQPIYRSLETERYPGRYACEFYLILSANKSAIILATNQSQPPIANVKVQYCQYDYNTVQMSW